MMNETLSGQIFQLMNEIRGISMRNNIMFARQNNMSMSQIGALFHMRSKGVGKISDISGPLGLSNAAVSQMLERLVQQGLILRNEAKFDRRAKVIELTEKGRNMIDEVQNIGRQWINEVVDTLSEDEQQQISPAIGLLLDRIQQMNKHQEEMR